MIDSAYRYAGQPVLLAFLAALLCGCAGTMREDTQAVNYEPDGNYHLLMAEIAAQRGEQQTAAQEYLAAAKDGKDSDIARRATEYAFDFGFDDLALQAARRWLKLAPDSSSAREYLGRLELRRHNVRAALGHFAELLGPADTRSGDDYLALESELSDEANAQGVTRLMVWLGAGQAPSAGYRLAVARAAFRSRDDDLALDWARRVLAENDSLEADLLISRVLFGSGDADAALRHLAQMLQARPLPLLELEFVRLLASSRREEAALQALERMIEAYGRQPELLLLRARVLLSDGDLPAAADDFRELADTGQSVYESIYYLGQIAADDGDPFEAIRQYLRIGSGPYLLPAQFRIAALRAEAGDLDAALAHLDAFAQLHPRSAFDLQVGKAQLLEQYDRDEAALTAFDQALQFKPDSPSLLLARGIVRDRLGETDRAIRDMRAAIKLAPYDPGTLNALGYTLSNHGRSQREAFALIRLALEQDRSNPAILDSMGWALFRRGDLDRARGFLQLAYDEFPDPEVAAHLGEVLWQSGSRDKARLIWQQALINHPDNQPLQEITGRYPL
jgi:tetratricopeptide (TPR) repeat protein